MDRKGPLAGVKVLDFTHVLSGSYGTMMLGDLGADIIKVERKGDGDALRNTPPLRNGQSAYFFCTNRNKRCLSLDLKKKGAVELVNRLVKNCDVFTENFRPGVMDRLGLGYEDILKVRPDIIYGSLSAFGETGPYRDKPGFELIIQSLVGLVDVTSDPEGRPAKVQPQVADICGGLYMAVAILGALYHRNQTGQGAADYDVFDGGSVRSNDQLRLSAPDGIGDSVEPRYPQPDVVSVSIFSNSGWLHFDGGRPGTLGAVLSCAG